MTPPIALAVNVTPPSPAPASTGSSASDANVPSAFSAPWQQARQQQSTQGSASSNPKAATSNASTNTPPPTPSSTTASSTTSGTGNKSVWNPTSGNSKDDDKPADSPSTPTDAATAMLALLGQSIPANATPTPAAPSGSAEGTTAAGTAVTAAALQVTGMPGMPTIGVAPGSAQPDDDDADDVSDAPGDLKGNALSALADAADDDTTPMTTFALGADAKLAAASQAATTPSTQGDQSDPLEALRNLTVPFMQAQAPLQSIAAPHVTAMTSSVGTPAFAQELGQQVVWMGGQNIKEARITLHPEDMGQLDVKVSVVQNHVDVSFIAQHPNAVHAVQQTLSQLDSMLAHHGLTLGQAHVGQGNSGGAGQGASPGSAAGGDASAADEGEVSSVVAPVVQALGLLDTFA